MFEQLSKGNLNSFNKWNICDIHLIIQSFKNYRFNYSFGPYFCSKVSNWSFNFFKFQFGPDFWKIDAIWSFLLNFLKQINNLLPPVSTYPLISFKLRCPLLGFSFMSSSMQPGCPRWGACRGIPRVEISFTLLCHNVLFWGD